MPPISYGLNSLLPGSDNIVLEFQPIDFTIDLINSDTILEFQPIYFTVGLVDSDIALSDNLSVRVLLVTATLAVDRIIPPGREALWLPRR